jgi:hypothetical protein
MYTVRWVQSALDALADVWTQATDRNAITTAVTRIDRALAVLPDDQGESRDEGRRILLEPPLGVIYTVDHDHRTVVVSDVWAFSKRA